VALVQAFSIVMKNGSIATRSTQRTQLDLCVQNWVTLVTTSRQKILQLICICHMIHLWSALMVILRLNILNLKEILLIMSISNRRKLIANGMIGLMMAFVNLMEQRNRREQKK
jgi:hypothetical protein